MKLWGKLRAWVRRRIVETPAPPGPPEWIRQQAEDFAALHPGAVVRDWVLFASLLGNRAHEAGFALGWECKAYELPATTPALVPVISHFLAGEALDKPVAVQAPKDYQHVTFVNERAVPMKGLGDE